MKQINMAVASPKPKAEHSDSSLRGTPASWAHRPSEQLLSVMMVQIIYAFSLLEKYVSSFSHMKEDLCNVFNRLGTIV